jgi:HPt (histidine-containing phosphotransfer) domain-containing protein
MNASPQLDPAALERLNRLGGDKFVREMIELFLDYAARKLAEARQAQQAGDLKGVQKAVHPIKSSAGNVGAVRMQELATRLETEAESGLAEAVAPDLAELEQAFAVVRQELAAAKQNLPPPFAPTSSP